MTFLEADGVSKSYRASSQSEVRAVDNVSLLVKRGSFTVLTGNSGSGKTTLLALLGAMERPSSGRIVFDSSDLTRCSGMELARIRRRVGFIFQDFSLVPNLTAVENITYPLIPRGWPRAERMERAQSLLSRFGMDTRLKSRAQELSGGEQQRVAIARAMAGRPEVILADEPTSNLDAETRDIVLAALRELHSGGATVVIASHDPCILAMGTTTVRLNQGRLV